MSFVTTAYGTDIYVKDWGEGRPVILAHGWPLSSDSWEAQQYHLAENGFRAVAHDRRGHGRSTQTWHGNDMDHYIPTLVIHGDDDQVVPFPVGGGASAAIVKGAALTVYEGAPHGITDTHKQQLADDLVQFVKS
ncbi:MULTISPECIES: alpha/beta fold hydrolase [unclassified Pseudofrankia]|uniref:alpha/beta fold hydrolase n=1 Tax=unclassified Pseudofrankia TaxID=2994372 RepID=UPI0008D9A20F|nr:MULTISPECIES: alpha/beta hydrolase [unclassified Pseudofrankia]MDT3439575.1 alpha/beta fold hydrolase [Pseudofrankia sp. BMG5.37]OHV48748.1 hypothetical protein BCD48_15095 [Pseudofrankia sp. BMG5.36]